MQAEIGGLVFMKGCSGKEKRTRGESMLFLGRDTRRGKSGTESEARETKLGVRRVIQIDLWGETSGLSI